MGLSKKHFETIIQRFHDGAYEDEGLQSLMSELHEVEVLTGVRGDPIIMGKIFIYLDMKLQDEIRANIKH